jgi:hypothetical protein
MMIVSECAARSGRAAFSRIFVMLIEIATTSNPASAAEAPTSATKKSCQASMPPP